MKYPYINKQSRREIAIPKLSGGLNLRDSITGVADNQLIDCNNMWYADGMLRTRPALKTSLSQINYINKENFNAATNLRFHKEICVNYGGYRCVLASYKMLINDEEQGACAYEIGFEFQSAVKTFALPSIENIGSGSDITYFLVEKGGVLYCYISNGSIYTLEYAKEIQLGEESPVWETLSESDIYVPIVYAHCKRSGWSEFEGTQFEGYNLIGNSYKMIYSAYNEADSDTSHPMRYALGQPLAKTGKISVEITSYDKDSERSRTVEHTISYTEDEYNSFSEGNIFVEKSADTQDGLYLFVKYNYVGFLFKPGLPAFGEIANLNTDELIWKYGFCEDNVVITAPIELSESEKSRVFNMTQSIWFGGSALGINGGSRLFLCGNTTDEQQALVIWSGLNNPLYFSENNYAYIGNSVQRVTGFGKQGENLIIFKENETYYSYYADNSSITADDLINQTVVDYQANSVYFPMITLHSSIGCDCPDSVQLCRNRLVWAHSDGNVYSLVSNNQYSEQTIYKVSEMIHKKLIGDSNLQTARSCDFGGHYILMSGKNIYVMDYNSYGYQYVYSCSKTEDSNIQIPWYCWEFPFLYGEDGTDTYTTADICAIGDVMLLGSYYNASNNSKKSTVSFAMSVGEYDAADWVYINDFNSKRLKLTENAIGCSLCTKCFELGVGLYNANIECVRLNLGLNDAAPITVKFITEAGEETVIVQNKAGATSHTQVGYIRPKNLYPSIKCILRLGVSLECEGVIAVDGLSLLYRLLGSAK